MKSFLLRAILIGVVFCLGCQSANWAPMSAEVVKAAAHAKVDEQTVRQGRSLFVSRCIECHTLPAYYRYNSEEWPRLVDQMSGRSNLKPQERDAVLSYIMALRAQK